MTQDGSVRTWDILASLSCSRRKWKHVIHLYLTNMSRPTNWTLSVVQPLMTPPPPKGPRSPSFFHTPVPLSPLGAMVTTAGHAASQTVDIPQRKLDVASEESWRETLRCLCWSCVWVLRLCGGRLVFLMLSGLFSVLQYSLPLSISQWPWFLSQSALKIAAGLGVWFQTNFTSNTHCDWGGGGDFHKLMEQNYNFSLFFVLSNISSNYHK